MMSAAPALILTLLAALSPAVHAQATSSAATKVNEALADGILASVNGRPIPELSVDNVAQQLTASGQDAQPEQILDELINLEILTQAAEELDLDKMPEISAALQLQYTQTMANAYLAQVGADMTFTDDELRAEYELQSAAVDRAEYRASHILLETDAEARNIIAELAEGKKFDALAKLYSIDPAGDNGGDLGWFQSNTMVPEFTAAVADMEIGDISQSPVQSEFGFHIIRLLDKRDAPLPDFETVKTGLINLAVRKALATHVEELRGAAQIQTR